MDNQNYKFSVLITVYGKEKAEYFRLALESTINQTLPPNEIVIVEDGPLTEELYTFLDEFKNKYSNNILIKIIKLKNNSGAGVASNIGLLHCSYDIIARVDSDDISVKTRFEKQIKFLKDNPNITLVGSYAAEFNYNPNKPISYINPPLTPEALYKRGQLRCPIHHPTVMYRKEAALNIGNYSNLRHMQDYELMGRLLRAGYEFAVIPEFLLKTRIGNGMHKKRSGLDYFFKYELKVHTKFYSIKYINLWQYLRNISLKFLLRCLPTPLLSIFYRVFLREHKQGN